MGYCAFGEGRIDTDRSNYKFVRAELEKEFEISDGSSLEESLFITISGNYHDTQIEKILTNLVGKATGSIDFSGEDDSYWTFILREDGWEEVPGKVIRDGDDALYEAVHTYDLCRPCDKDCCYANDGMCRYYLVKECKPVKENDVCKSYIKEVA